MNWLTEIGLRFENEEREAAFFREFSLKNRLEMQIAFFLGGIIFYVFYIWDQIIDPNGWETPHAIRSIFVLVTWAGALALFSRKLDKIFELYCISFATAASVLLSLIYHFLRAGFNFGAVGIVLVIFFAFCLLSVRITFLASFCFISWISFDLIQLISDNHSNGMFLVNNLSIGTAVFLGLYSAYVRESSARIAFVTRDKLDLADTRVDELIQSISSSISRRSHEEKRPGQKDAKVKIAISYRRNDSEAMAGRIRDRLVKHFGESSIFMDIDSIPPGVDFRDHLKKEIRSTDILLAVIGPNWIGRNNDSVRISNPADPVRMEVEVALQGNVPIIPVLVFEAKMPSVQDLPSELECLMFKNAIEVDVGRDFHHHMDRLVRAIANALNAAESTTG